MHYLAHVFIQKHRERERETVCVALALSLSLSLSRRVSCGKYVFPPFFCMGCRHIFGPKVIGPIGLRSVSVKASTPAHWTQCGQLGPEARTTRVAEQNARSRDHDGLNSIKFYFISV